MNRAFLTARRKLPIPRCGLRASVLWLLLVGCQPMAVPAQPTPIPAVPVKPVVDRTPAPVEPATAACSSPTARKTMKWILLSLVLALTWLMVGCRPLTPAAELTTPTLVATSQLVTPIELSITSTPTQRPTATTPLTTSIPETSTATPDIAGIIVATIQPRSYGSYLSPDGQWRVEVIIYDCARVSGLDEKAYEMLKLIQVSDGTEKIADSQLIYCGGLGAFGLTGLFWSPNSRYFYYTNTREGVPDGCGYWERSLIRLDVTNLNVEYLGSGPHSPDGTKLATWQARELVVWDINEGEIARISAIAPNAQTGPIAWSPDSQALVYVQFESYCPLYGTSYVIRLDLPEFKQTLLLESATPSFGGVIWDVPNELSLFDENGKEWRYSFGIQELKSVP